MIPVTEHIAIGEDELAFAFVRASGPGGQNVNKVATAVQLRFDAAGSPSLPQDVKRRLLRLAGRRATEDGVIVLDARAQRSQQQNRREAVGRLLDLIRRAAIRPRPRRKTRPTASSRQRRLAQKRRRAHTKELRRRVGSDEQ